MSMRNEFSGTPFSPPITGMLPLLLILALIPSACSSSKLSVQSVSVKAAETVLDSPEAVAGRFIAVCLARDRSTALDLLAPETREAVLGEGGGNPCSQVSAGANSATLAATEKAGNTIYVTFAWQQHDGVEVQYQLLLTKIDGTWRIFDDHKSRQRPTRMPITPAPTIAPSNITLTQATGRGE